MSVFTANSVFANRAFSRPKKRPLKWRAPRCSFSKPRFQGEQNNMSTQQSPLFEPVVGDGEGFKILRQLQVPGPLEIIGVSEVDQALEAVRSMKTRAFGQ